MWSVCGIHDQGWAERNIFGKIRYMNFEGCKRKFNIDEYVARWGGKEYNKSINDSVKVVSKGKKEGAKVMKDGNPTPKKKMKK